MLLRLLRPAALIGDHIVASISRRWLLATSVGDHVVASTAAGRFALLIAGGTDLAPLSQGRTMRLLIVRTKLF